MHETTLKNLGVSENEARIYVALLELGISKVEPISRRVQLPRTTIYGVLRSLLEKGFTSYIIKSGIKYYEATNPKRLLLAEQEKLEELKSIIPELEQIKESIGERPHIEMYEGKEGIKSIYEDILKTKQTIYGYGNTKLLFELLNFFVPNYIKRRKNLNIKFYIVTEKSKTALEMKKKDKEEKRETKFLKEMEKMATLTYIYGDKTAIMMLLKKQPFGILIKSQEIVQSNKLLFEMLSLRAQK